MAIIPARLGSTRLKNKPLIKINGKSLIGLVAEEVKNTGLFKEVVVATDSDLVADLFKDSDIKTILTGEHESGTDRIYEAFKKSNLKEVDAVLNIQGDEPFVYKEDLVNLMSSLKEGYKMVSLYERLDSSEDLNNLNKVKVILNQSKEAIYFSRFPIPFSRVEAKKPFLKEKIGKHVGIYGYEKDFLKIFCEQEVSFLEAHEKLEQLRALEMGERIKMNFTENSYKGVDVESDIKEVEELLKKRMELK